MKTNDLGVNKMKRKVKVKEGQIWALKYPMPEIRGGNWSAREYICTPMKTQQECRLRESAVSTGVTLRKS